MEEEQKTTANSNQKENTSTQNNEASTPANNNPKSQNRTNNTKPKRKVPTSGNGWNNDLIKAFEKNEKIQKDRLNPHNKLNLKTEASIKVTPLGGLGEIGGNMMVIETEKCAVVVDVGMSFPDETMHGVDILIPDFTYLRSIRSKIVGILITHGHEDHIGAMPYLFREMQFPVYGTSLPLEMIGSKFDEHKMREHKSYFRAIEKRKPIKIGDFEIEWMHITHSIIDCSALAITTEAGTIIHTGDFKIDHTPIDGYPTDIHRLAYYGEKGLLALLSDSTNSHSPGFTKSEMTVGPTFDKIFANAKGRVIMSTFSSNIHRVAQAIQRGIDHGRKICVIGRSMEKNLDLAMKLGYVTFPKDKFIDAHEVNKYVDKEVLIVTTGSQGEPMSALYRMSIHEHRHIKIKPEDQIILSARAIPGNEAGVSEIINKLMQAGASVAYQDYTDIHVSGHAGQEEQKLMLRICKPKFFLPIHGEYNHAVRHGKTGVSCGVFERNVYIMSDGEQVEISPKFMKKVKSVKTGKVYIDNQRNNKISNDVVIDRQTMANDGIVVVIAQITASDRKLVSPAKISTFGLTGGKGEKYLITELEEILAHYLENVKDSVLSNNKLLEDELRKVIRKHCLRKYRKYPMIVPTLFVQ
jgi:ribonuclease J